MKNKVENCIPEITSSSPRDQWVNCTSNTCHVGPKTIHKYDTATLLCNHRLHNITQYIPRQEVGRVSDSKVIKMIHGLDSWVRFCVLIRNTWRKLKNIWSPQSMWRLSVEDCPPVISLYFTILSFLYNRWAMSVASVPPYTNIYIRSQLALGPLNIWNLNMVLQSAPFEQQLPIWHLFYKHNSC